MPVRLTDHHNASMQCNFLGNDSICSSVVHLAHRRIRIFGVQRWQNQLNNATGGVFMLLYIPSSQDQIVIKTHDPMIFSELMNISPAS